MYKNLLNLLVLAVLLPSWIYAFQACDHFLNFSISQVTDIFADKPKEIQRCIFIMPMEIFWIVFNFTGSQLFFDYLSSYTSHRIFVSHITHLLFLNAQRWFKSFILCLRYHDLGCYMWPITTFRQGKNSGPGAMATLALPGIVTLPMITVRILN